MADKLKSYQELKNIPIIAVTSYAMVGDRGKILTAGANGYIEKPIDPDNFVSKIIQYLEEYRKNKEQPE